MKRVSGQAAVEMALGMLVMVTILMFGVHFGEIGYLGAKLHEASAAALWDSTAYRTHTVTPVASDFAGSPSYDSAPAVAAVQNTSNAFSAAARYQDFDGRTSEGTSGAPAMALTSAGLIKTTCAKAGTYALGFPSPYGEPGGITCSATADISVANISTNFVDQSHGFFGENQVLRKVSTLCSSGRFTAGSCGTMQMLLGDDGLHTGLEAGECTLQGTGDASCADNPNFYGVAKKVFDNTMPFTGMPEGWASKIIPDVPGNHLTGFYMSFRGETSPYGPFNERVAPPPNPPGNIWETSPHLVILPSGQPYLNAYTARQTCTAGGYCYLGKFNCN